jgi:hypothetical protein
MEETIQFEEGKPCPVQVTGSGGGLSFSPNGDMLLIGAFPNPSEAQIEAWCGKWRAKLAQESEFPSIPLFAVGSEDWLIEAPCNPSQLEKEAPGFCEALYAKEDHIMVAVLVDLETTLIKKITQVTLDDIFIERLVLGWNPYRHAGDQYNKSYDDEAFAKRIQEIYKHDTSRELWMKSW